MEENLALTDLELFQVTPVPVHPSGTFFYRAKNFYRRNVWTLIFSWGNKVKNWINYLLIIY